MTTYQRKENPLPAQLIINAVPAAGFMFSRTFRGVTGDMPRASSATPRRKPNDVANDIPAIEQLRHSCRILAGDYRAAREFAFIAQRRNYAGYRDHFAAAIEVLDGCGGRAMVETVVLAGQMPRSDQGMRQLLDGLHALHEHFRIHGLPIVLVEPANDGSRPLVKLKRQR